MKKEEDRIGVVNLSPPTTTSGGLS